MRICEGTSCTFLNPGYSYGSAVLVTISRTLSILRVGPRVTTSAQRLCIRLSRAAWESRKRAARCLAYSFPWSMRFIRSRESGARWTIMVVVVVVLNFRPFHCAHSCAPPRAAVARWGTPTRSGMFTQQLDSGAVTGLLNIAELVEIVPRALRTSYRVSQQSYHLGIASGIVVQYDQEPINMNPWQLHHGPGKTIDLALALPGFALASTKPFDSQHIHSPR